MVTTGPGSAGGELGRHLVEQLVLFALERRDLEDQGIAVASHGVGLAPGVAGLDIPQRGLGHDRAHPGVVGFLLEERHLLAGDLELGAQALQPITDVDEASLDEGSRHRRRV